MPRLPPLNRDEVPDALEPLLNAGEAMMGFTPNDALTLAHRPNILKGLFELIKSVYLEGTVDPGLKRLIGEAASKSAGCMYCSAHAAFGAANHGVPHEKIEAVWTDQGSDVFTPAERAAITVAMSASRSPSQTTDQEMDTLRAHFDDGEIVEIISVIAMFGFLNRWNMAMATELEQMPQSLRDVLENPDQKNV